MSLSPDSGLADEARFSFGASATGVYQAGSYDDATNEGGRSVGDTSRGSLVVDVDGEWRISHAGLLFAAASFAEGNGLNGAGGISVAVNGDDLEDDVKGINGRNRDYLLEAFYAHRFESRGPDLTLAGGIIDSARYIDSNRVANDETRQFMNEVFVNQFFQPSYDPGVALTVSGEGWEADGVWMKTRIEDASGSFQDFDFFGVGVESGYELAAGEGRLSLLGLTTSESFDDDTSAVSGVGISADQNVGDHWMLFLRAVVTSDEPTVLTHKALYSGGLQLNGSGFALEDWTGALAFAYLEGAGDAPGDIRETRVWEAYARWKPSDRLGLSLDIQYIRDEIRQESDPRLWAVGLRVHYSM